MTFSSPTARDQANIEIRIASARGALAAATSERARAEALFEEASAALDLELLGDRANLVHPEIRAAMLQIGELSEREVIDALRLLSPSALDAALVPLLPVLSSSAWNELVQLVPAARSHAWRWIDHAQKRGDLRGCLAVFSLGATCTAAFVADVYEQHGAASAALFAEHARSLLEAASVDEPLSITDEAALLLALPADEIRPRALSLADAVAVAEIEFDEGYGERDPRSVLVLGLVSCGEIQRALALFEGVLRVPNPANPDATFVTAGLRRALVALSGALSAEQRLALHRSVYERFASATLEPAALVALCELLDEPYASRCARDCIAVIEGDSTQTLWVFAGHPLVRARCVERSRSLIEDRLSLASLESADRYALSTALASLPTEEALAPWVIERFEALDRAISADRIARYRPLQWLLAAAKAGSATAQRALIARIEAGDRLWETPMFFDRLPAEVVRVAVRFASRAQVSWPRREYWSQRFARFLVGANESERERWWPTLRALHEGAGDSAGLIARAEVVPAREASALVREHAAKGFRTMHDAEALARAMSRHGLAGEVVERAMQRFGPKNHYARVDWLNALLVRFVSEARASQWLAECYAPDAPSPAAFSPREVQRFIESQDVFASDEWLRRAPSRGLVAALSALEGTAPLLERCAAACWALWLREGGAPETAAWFSLRDFIAHASLETASAMANHRWNADSQWAAHRVCVRLAELRRRDPSSTAAIVEAALALAGRFSQAAGSPWFRACIAWVIAGDERSFDAVFRPVVAGLLDDNRVEYASDCVALGLCDEVFALGDELSPGAALAFIRAMSAVVSDAAFERAIAWIAPVVERDFDGALAVLRARVTMLSPDVLASRWETELTRREACEVFGRPEAIRALAGDEGFVRIGDALARAVDALSQAHGCDGANSVNR